MRSSPRFTNDPKMIELVLAHGAQIDEKDFWGRDALMSACIYVKTAAVPCLLDRKAPVDATDEDGVTALMLPPCKVRWKTRGCSFNTGLSWNCATSTDGPR